MKRFGLIGYPLNNTFSADYFNEKFNRFPGHVYQNFPLSSLDDFPLLLKDHPDLAGVNVTIPHKVTVLKYLNELDPAAGKVGAVNCIRIVKKDDTIRKLVGFNTDIDGFESSLGQLIRNDTAPLKALILGTGGSAKAVAYVLDKKNIPYTHVSRQPGKMNTVTYQQLTQNIVEAHRLIINCTPAGMFPDTGSMPPINTQHIGPSHFVFDLIYLPEQTELLKRSRERGASVQNGLEMLHLQAGKALEIFLREDDSF